MGWKERHHMSFCDARVFRNSGLVLGWILSQIFPLKNGLLANCVCPPRAPALYSAVSPKERSLVHLSQSTLLRLQLQGKFHKYQGVWVKTVYRELFEIPDVLNCLYKNKRIF